MGEWYERRENVAFQGLDSSDLDEKSAAIRRVTRLASMMLHCRVLADEGSLATCSNSGERGGSIMCRARNEDHADLIEALLTPGATDPIAIPSTPIAYDEDAIAWVAHAQRLFYRRLAGWATVSCPFDCPIVVDLDVSSTGSWRLDFGATWFVVEYKITWGCEKPKRKKPPAFTPRGNDSNPSSGSFSVESKRPVKCPDDGFVRVCGPYKMSMFGRPLRFSKAEKKNVRASFDAYFASIRAQSWACATPCKAIKWNETREYVDADKVGAIASAGYCQEKTCECRKGGRGAKGDGGAKGRTGDSPFEQHMDGSGLEFLGNTRSLDGLRTPWVSPEAQWSAFQREMTPLGTQSRVDLVGQPERIERVPARALSSIRGPVPDTLPKDVRTDNPH